MGVRRPSALRSRPVAVGAALVVAALGMAGTFLLSRNAATPSGPAASSSGPTLTVVVARIPIAQGSKITLSELSTASLPVSTLPQDAVKDPALVANLFAGVDISANQYIVPSMLLQAPSTGPVQLSLIKVDPGDVAVAIPDDPIKGAGGYVVAGDHIDILIDLNGSGLIKYGFQDVPVLKSGSNGHTEGVSDLLLVELPRRQAEQMTLILSGHNTQASVVKYALRPVADYGKGYLANGGDIPAGAAAAQDSPVSPQGLNTVFSGQ